MGEMRPDIILLPIFLPGILAIDELGYESLLHGTPPPFIVLRLFPPNSGSFKWLFPIHLSFQS